MASRMLAYPPVLHTARCPLHTVKQREQQGLQMTTPGRDDHEIKVWAEGDSLCPVS